MQLAFTSFGRIHVMVNTAGLMPLSPLSMLKVQDWNQMIGVNSNSTGAVDTELAQSITVPEIAAGVQLLYRNIAISGEAFAEWVAFAISQPEAAHINEVLFCPTSQEL